MPGVIGHQRIREQLEDRLPQVMLFAGPKGVGKRTLAEYLISYYRVHPWDTIRIEDLTAAFVRGQLWSFLQAVPPASALKVILAELDGARSEVQQSLLKILEESPEAVHFLLIASEPVLPTISSRAQTYRFTRLSPEDTVAVLMAQGLSRAEADVAASFARGCPGGALERRVEAQAALVRVKGALVAAREGDVRTLDTLFREWGDPEHRLLEVWATEVLTELPRIFDDRETPREAARVVFEALSWSSARPRISDRAILDLYRVQNF